MGKVRFVVLAHSMCAHGGEVSNVCDPSEGNRTAHTNCWAQRAAQAVDIARRFGDDAVIVRYEDLCLQWEETMQALESWEPLLGGIGLLGDIPVQRLTHGHSHSELSFNEYCAEVNLPKWKAGFRLPRPVLAKGEMASVHTASAAYLGYTSVDACWDPQQTEKELLPKALSLPTISEHVPLAHLKADQGLSFCHIPKTARTRPARSKPTRLYRQRMQNRASGSNA